MKLLILCRNLCVILLLLAVFSCSTSNKILVRKKVKPLSDNKLQTLIEDNKLEYSAVYFKRFTVSVNDNGRKKNYKGVMKIQKDSAVWVSMTAPLGIEVARILITRDSVKFIDRYHKDFFVGGMDFFEKKFNNNIDFFTLQSILTNSPFQFSPAKDRPFKRNFKGSVDEGMYHFYTFKEERLVQKYKKLERKKKKNKPYSEIYQSIFIDPELYRVRKVEINELAKEWRFKTEYSDFESFGEKIFPKKIKFVLKTPNQNLECRVFFSKLEFTDKVRLSFRIPDSYSRIK